MNLTYIFLLLSVLSSIFVRNSSLIAICLFFTVVVSLIQGIAEFSGIFLLTGFGGLCYAFFHKYKSEKFEIRGSIFIGLMMAACLFGMHLMPGFENLQIVKGVKLSENSCPFSMYLNYDKVMIGIILFIFSPLMLAEKPLDKDDLKTTLQLFGLCAVSVLVPAYLTSYVKFDFKVPSISAIWMINNLFFVCFAEEVIFRGVLQNFLKEVFAKYFRKNKYLEYLPIIATAIIFGVLHFHGGFIYIVLSTIAGLFYGYTYHKTGKLLSSMLVHFGVNFTHFIFFTYPAYIAICG